MQTAPAGFFPSDINGQDASNKLPYFPAGFIGTVKISACKGITKRDSSRAFVAELEVVTSNIPETVRVGGKYSWFQSMKESGTAYPACISFLYAALGLDSVRDKATIEAKVKPRQDFHLNNAVSDTNPLAGATLHLQTALKKTKAGKDFTLHNFAPAVKATA